MSKKQLKPCPFCGGDGKMLNKNGIVWIRCSTCSTNGAPYFTEDVAVEAWNRRAEPPNKPLTLDELRQMDGEPVWIIGVSSINNFKGTWDICEWENGEVVSFPYCCERPSIRDYGITWLAYRRRPEEG